jgi:hypothetical protein
MATTMERMETTGHLGLTLESIGEKAIRYGLVVILLGSGR